jgi:hypothetical protein
LATEVEEVHFASHEPKEEAKMEAELLEFRKSLSTQSSGVVESSALLSTRGASVPGFNQQVPLEEKTQSEILRQLGMEMSQSPQATILRRMKEEARNKDTSLGKLEDERIAALEKEAMVLGSDLDLSLIL